MVISSLFLTGAQLKSTKTIYLMYYLISFIELCKYLFTLNVMAATCFIQVRTGPTIHWESCGMHLHPT